MHDSHDKDNNGDLDGNGDDGGDGGDDHDGGDDGNAFANYSYLWNVKKKFHETHLN